MKKAPKKDLVVIGTARKPNASDLRNRGLSGLPDPSPEVALRRAEFELEQEALRAQVALLQGENELSFLRTKIGVHRSTDDDASGLDPGIVASKMSGDPHLVEVGKATARMEVSDLPESPVADNEAGGPESAKRSLRNRSPIQLHPYELERKVYHQTVKVRRAE